MSEENKRIEELRNEMRTLDDVISFFEDVAKDATGDKLAFINSKINTLKNDLIKLYKEHLDLTGENPPEGLISRPVSKQDRLKEIDEEIAALELVSKDVTMSEEEIAIASSKIAELKFEADDIMNMLTSEADDPNTPSERELTGERLTEPSPDLDDALDNVERTMLDEGNTSVDDLGFVPKVLSEKEKKVEEIETLLGERYKEFIAKDPGDTEPFSILKGTGRPSFEISLLPGSDEKFLLLDLLTIDPSKQSSGAGSLIVGELVRWADENDMHVIATPVSGRVQDAMEKYGGQYIDLLGYHYFGWKKDEVIELAKERFVASHPQVVTEMNNYIRDILALDDEMFNALVEASGEKDGVLVTKIRGGEIDNPSALLTYVENTGGLGLVNVMNAPPAPGASVSALPPRGDIGTPFYEVYGNLTNVASTPMDKWLTNTIAGQRFVLSLIARFNNAPDTIHDVESLREGISKEISEMINYTVDDNVNKQYNAGRAIEVDLNSIHNQYASDLDAGISEGLAKYIHEQIYDNDARNLITYNNPFTGIVINNDMNSNAPLSMTANENGMMTIYRAMNDIDASLGLRETNVTGGGLSAKGFGRSSYFTSSANYANAYKGRTNYVGGEIYEAQININDLEIGAGSIINLQHPIGLYPELIFEFNEIAESEIININDKVDRKKTIEEVWFNNNLSDASTSDARLNDLVKLLKDFFDYQVIVNMHTGPGQGIIKSYLDATGFVEQTSIHPQWAEGAPMPVDEIIFIDTKTLTDKVKIVGKVTEIGFGVPKTEPIEPLQKVVQKLINRAFEDFNTPDLKGEGGAVSVVSRMQDIYRTLDLELSNRPDEIRLANLELLEQVNTLRRNIQAVMNENGGYKYATIEQIQKGVQYRDISTVVRYETMGIWDPRTETYKSITDIISEGFNHKNSFIHEYYVDKNGQVKKRMLMIDQNDFSSITPFNNKKVPVIDEAGMKDNIGYFSNYELAWVPNNRLGEFESKFNIDRIISLEAGGPLLKGKQFYDEGRLSDEFKELISRPDTTLEFNITHASPHHKISINDVQGGYDPMVPVVDRTTGEVKFMPTPDSRNQEYLVGLSTSFEDDIIFNKYSSITGKSIGNPAKNYFTVRLNTDNLYTLDDIRFNWINKFSISDAAKAMDVPPSVVIEAFENANLIMPSNRRLVDGFMIKAHNSDGVRQFYYKFKEAAKNILSYKTDQINPTVTALDITRLMRGGGIEALVENPNMYFGNFEELMLLDPNDQAGIGKAIDIIDIDEETYNLNRDSYKLISQSEVENNPLRNYEDIDKNIKQTSLDEAYDIRINFESGFNTAETEALGLKGDLPEFVANSVLSDDDARKLIEVGEAIITAPEATPLLTSAGTTIDLFTLHENAYNNLANVTALTEVEYHTVRGILDKDAKAVVKDASGPGGAPRSVVQQSVQAQVDEALSKITPGLIDDSAKWKLLQGARNKLAYSAGLRGAAPTGLILLDLYEIALWGGALAYGTSDAWSAEFENIVKGVSNKVFGTAYTMETPGEIDYEKLNNTLLFAEKASPTEWVLGPIIDDYKGVKYANSPGRGNDDDDNRQVIDTLGALNDVEPTEVLAPVQLGNTEVYVTGKGTGPNDIYSDGTISQGKGVGTWWSRYFDYQRFSNNKQFYNRNNDKKQDNFETDMFTTNLYSTDNNSDYWRRDY